MTAGRDVLALVDGDPGHEQLEAPACRLATLLNLTASGLTISRATIHGKGSAASADLHLSDGTVIEFEALKDVANPTKLAIEVIATTGAIPKLKTPDAHLALMLLREVADHQAVHTKDDISTDTGMEFLQSVQVIDIDMHDQAARWAAFSYLNEINPAETAKLENRPYAECCYVIRDLAGNRYVRAGWFYGFAKHLDKGLSQSEVAHRMERVGWQRRGKRGAIKATAPARNEQLVWNFYVVPAGWNDTPNEAAQVVGLSQVSSTRAHATEATASRVEATTGDNPGAAA